MTALMRVSGTPQRPKPLHSKVDPEGRSLMASEAEETTLLISRWMGVVLKVRAANVRVVGWRSGIRHV